jgi:uncharacterized protein with FMN-binding domain
MRRAVLTLAGTAAGLAALLSFKTHSPAAAAPAAPAASTPETSAAAASPTMASSGATPAMPKSGASTATRTVTGSAAMTPYGPMQVKITLAGQRITKATVVQQTDDGTESQQIDSFAIPKLTSETIAAQSARIDAVSGASYTSSGYIKSLQSALDQAKAG